jgi:hypothetical protein
VICIGKVSNLLTRIYLDPYDLSGYLNAVNTEVMQQLIGVGTFSDTGPRRIPGNYDHKAGINGFYDPLDDQIDEILEAVRGVDTHYLLVLYGNNAENAVAYESIVDLSDKPLSGQVGGAVLLNAAFEGSNSLTRGTLLRSATITGNGNGTGRNLGATISGQEFGVVYRVLSGTFTSFDLKTQESSDDGGGDAYADVAGLTQSFSAAGVARKSTTAVTEAWKRTTVANWIGTSALVLVTAGRAAALP